MQLAASLLVISVIMFICVIFNKVSGKLGVPMLLAFIVFGLFFGNGGIVKIVNVDIEVAKTVCSVSLIFIMFYGGFGTKWSAAKPVAVKAGILSSVGTFLTALLVGLFCYLVLKIGFIESMLLGSVIASTDAASVFSILRSRKLNFKYNTASLLEVESGSNDPFSYMLTVVFLTLLKSGSISVWDSVYLVLSQVVLGAACGVAIAWFAVRFFKRFSFGSSGFDAIFMMVVALFAYALPESMGGIPFLKSGNGYLSVYIAGIIIGNSKIKSKKSLVNFFDALTGLMQMFLFFLLGVLASPMKIIDPKVLVISLSVAAFLTFVARPLAVFAILTPFKSRINQQLLVSWAGMRGAASIVFAIMAITSDGVILENDILHIVFGIVLFSILLQGTLMPYVGKTLKMTDDSEDVMKTFTDYVDETAVQFIRFKIPGNHPWAGKKVAEIALPPECILALLIRDGEKMTLNGSTVIKSGDVLIMSGNATDTDDRINLYERKLRQNDYEVGKRISEVSFDGNLVIMIRRGDSVIIPHGTTLLCEGDVLVLNESQLAA